MADFIEIFLIARDLASGNINKAATKIEKDLQKAKGEAALAGVEFDRMGQKIDRSARGFDRPLKAIDDLVAKLPKATSKVGDFAQRVSEDMAKAGQQLDINFEQMAGHAEQLTLHLDKAGTEFGKLGRQAEGLKGGLRDAGNTFRLLRSEIQRTNPEMSRMGVNMRATETHVRSLARSITSGLHRALSDLLGPITRVGGAIERGLTARFSRATAELGRHEAALSSLGNAFVSAGASAVGALGQIAGLIGGIGLMGGAIAIAVPGVVALSGSVVSLTGALSTLSASFVALPAAIAVAGGALAAFQTILKPAISGIGQYISAQSKIASGQTAAPSAGTGGTSNQQAVRNAEIALKNARINAVQSVQSAELSLRNTRANAILSLISLEQRLQQLRASNAQKQAQLEAALQDARAAAATESSSGGRGDQALAQAFVGEAQGQLTSFKTTARGQENQLLSQIARQKIASDQAIQSSELRLTNARINAAQSIASAQRSLAQAQKSQGAAAASALSTEARLYQHLTPLQKQVADQILAIKSEWSKLGVVVSAKNSFLKEIINDLTVIQKNLPLLGRDTAGFANTITGGLAGARGLFANKQGNLTGLGQRALGGGAAGTLGANGGFAGFANRQFAGVLGAPGASGGAPSGLLALIDAITRFSTSAPARTFLRFLTTTARGLGEAALAAEKTSEATGHLATFFQHGQTVMTLLGHTIRDVFVALKNLGSLAFPQGQGLLKSLADAAKHFRQFTEAPANASKIKHFFQDADGTVRVFGHALGILARALAGLGGDAIKGGKKSALAQFFDVLAGLIPQVAGAIKTFAKGVGPDLLQLLKDLGPLVKNLGSAGGGLGLFVRLLDHLVRLVTFLTGSTGIGKFAGEIFILGYIFKGALGQLALFLVKLGLVNLGILEGEAAAGVMATAEAIATAATVLWGLAMDALPFVAIGIAIGVLAYLVYKHFGQIKKIVIEVFDYVKNFIEHHWKDILAFFLGPLGFAYLIFKFRHQLWDKFKALVTDAMDFLKKAVPVAIHAIVDFLTNTAPSLLRRAMGALWGGVKDVTATVLTTVINQVIGFVDDIIGAINFVLKHIGLSSHQIGKIDTVSKQQVESGSLPSFDEGGTVPGPKGAPTVIVAHGGETVLPTHKGNLGSAIGTLKSVGGSVLGAAGSAADFLLSPFKDLLPSVPHIPGFLGDMVMGSMGFIKDKVVSWGEGKLGSILSLGGGGPGGGPSVPIQVLRSLQLGHEIDSQNRFLGLDWGTAPASAALRRYPGGRPPWSKSMSSDQISKAANLALILSNALTPANLSALVGRARQESGFQSGVINQWDSNWTAGIPSMGFLQMVDGTFRSHMLSPLTNIWDPLHNATSAVRYMLAAYHRIVGPSSTGYDIGGVIGQREGYLRDVASGNRNVGQPIRILAHIGEWVLNREQQARVANAFGGLQNAKAAIFQGKSVPAGGSYAAGGIVSGRRGGGAWGRPITQNFTINTASPKVDIDYIARLAESRMAHLAEA